MTALQTGHIGLNVSDLAQSRTFYQTVFDFQVVKESQADGRRYVFLGDGDKLVLTLWQQSTGRFGTAQPGLHHLSFQVETVAEVEQAAIRLKALGAAFVYDGIVPHSEGAHSGGIFFEDPDGIRLEIYTPTGIEMAHAPVADAPTCGFF